MWVASSAKPYLKPWFYIYQLIWIWNAWLCIPINPVIEILCDFTIAIMTVLRLHCFPLSRVLHSTHLSDIRAKILIIRFVGSAKSLNFLQKNLVVKAVFCNFAPVNKSRWHCKFPSGNSHLKSINWRKRRLIFSFSRAAGCTFESYLHKLNDNEENNKDCSYRFVSPCSFRCFSRG